MTLSKITLSFLLLAAVALAAPQYDDFSSNSNSDESGYDFSWSVEDDSGSYENRYGHREQRKGHYTKGSYYVLPPDGRLQYVNYVVDGNSGFVADVSYGSDSDESYGSDESNGSDDSYGSDESNGSDDRFGDDRFGK